MGGPPAEAARDVLRAAGDAVDAGITIAEKLATLAGPVLAGGQDLVVIDNRLAHFRSKEVPATPACKANCSRASNCRVSKGGRCRPCTLPQLIRRGDAAAAYRRASGVCFRPARTVDTGKVSWSDRGWSLPT
jgi:hypothetical protein